MSSSPRREPLVHAIGHVAMTPLRAVMWVWLTAAFRVVDWLDERGEQR